MGGGEDHDSLRKRKLDELQHERASPKRPREVTPGQVSACERDDRADGAHGTQPQLEGAERQETDGPQASFGGVNELDGVDDLAAVLGAAESRLPGGGAVPMEEEQPPLLVAEGSVAVQPTDTDQAPAAAVPALVPAPSQAQSTLQPQCAMIQGSALVLAATVAEHAPALCGTHGEQEVSTSSPPDLQPSRHYEAVREELAHCLLQPTDCGVSWEAFPNHLGDGVRSRLLSLATLHLTLAGARAPAAVCDLAANSNRVLLGAANNCELYQERVIRALAARVGVPVLVVDAYSLKLDDVMREDAPGQPGANCDELFRGGGGTPDLEPASDDEDFLSEYKKEDKAGSIGARSRKPSVPVHRSGIPPLFLPSSAAAQNADRARASKAAAAAAAAAVAAAAEAVDVVADAAAHAKAKTVQVKERTTQAKAEAEQARAKANELAQVAAGAGEASQVGTVKPREVAEAADAADETGPAPATTEQGSVGRPQRTEGKPTDVTAARVPAADKVAEAMDRAAAALTSVLAKAGERPPLSVPAAGAPAAAAYTTVAQPFKRGDRVSYLGRLLPGVASSHERLEALQAAIARMEAAGQSSRLRDYLPTLILRARGAAARGAERNGARMQLPDAPAIGAKGRVVGVAGDKVEVAFDESFPGGASLPGYKEHVGWTCAPVELAATPEEREDPWAMSFTALFDVVQEEGAKGPLIVLIQNLDRLVRSTAADHFRKLEALLAGLPPRCLLFAGYCSRSLNRSDAARSGGGLGGMGRFMGLAAPPGLGSSSDSFGSALDDLPEMCRYGRLARGAAGGVPGGRKSTKARLLSSMFRNQIELHPPNQESAMKAWRQMVEADVAALRTRANRVALRKALARCGLACDDLAAVAIADVQLGKRDVEQLVGVAVAEQLAAEGPDTGDVAGSAASVEAGAGAGVAAAGDATCGPAGAAAVPDVAAQGTLPQLWTLRASHVMAAAEAVRRLQAEAAAQSSHATSLSQVASDQYEKQLLSEVIPPDEINVRFDDIGALEQVKTTLHEVVILPLQRPELFTRGALTKPTKGLLLFGPPGTGKTMLAKAVASESCAHFINVNMSALTSKWFGEGERLVRALFGLAHKLAPSVVFVDEIDSFLSKRGDRSSEHEALRKMKNEFMSHWDGLRTKLNDRVLVLAATNRPMDLDDAVIRRMPRRIFVPLPDAANREKILQVILKDEELDPGFDCAELAAITDGYSGSDLKNLCIAAAYYPIREYLEAEKAAGVQAAQKAEQQQQQPGSGGSASAGAAPAPGAAGASASGHVAPQLVAMRAISLEDFRAAAKQVTASSSSDSATLAELRRWNEQYGEGGSRQKEQLVYFT